MSQAKKRPEEILEGMTQEEVAKLLNSPAEEDSDMKQFSAVYHTSERALGKENHPDVMEIAEFMLAEADAEILSSNEFYSGIKSHIEVCPLCHAEYLSLQEELPQIKKTADTEKPQPVRVIRRRKKFSLKKILYYPIRIAAVFFIGWLAVYSASELTMPQAVRYGAPDITQDGVSRALTSDTFSETHTLVSEERYDEAIALLLSQIEKDPDDKSAFYLHFTAGKLYLLSSKSDFFGMLKSYDSDKVARAQQQFLTAIEKNYSGKYENVTYDASFYLAKTYILQNNFSKAKEQLEYVAGSKGSKSREAAKLLSEL